MASMDTAPRTGEKIEALFDGEWMEVYWGHTDDGSPYGTEGWGQVDGGYFIDTHPAREIEAWRPLNAVSYGEPSGVYGHRRRQPIVVLGLGFGDEAKGSTVDYLSATVPDAAAVVRWSGGANAAHNVRHGGRHHTFRQFGSGTFLGIPTYISDGVVVNLEMLMEEATALEAQGVADPISLVTLHSNALVTTPIHIALNRAREILRGSGRHGSCGLGIGETVVHSNAERSGLDYHDTVGNFTIEGKTAGGRGVLTLEMLAAVEGDSPEEIITVLKHQENYAELLIEQARLKVPELAAELDYGSLEHMAEELIAVAKSFEIVSSMEFDREILETMARGTVIFEGSQGLLLDEYWGFHPHTTWSNLVPLAIFEWLRDFGHQPYVLGLTRSFTTRHGAGPLPSAAHGALDESELPEDDNSWGRWQGEFRNAPLDLPLLSYSKHILLESGIDLDGIAVSHLDAFEGENLAPVVTSYGGRKDPSQSWNFKSDGAELWARTDSDVFLAERVIGQGAELKHYSAEELPLRIAEALGAPVVITADGPARLDRKIYIPSEEGN